MDELARKASALSAAYPVEENVHLPDSTRALVISYRARKIIPPAQGKQFIWEHLVRLLAARYLVMCGWSRDAVAQRLQERSADYLASNLTDLSITQAPVQPDNEDDEAQFVEQANIVVQLLACGVVQQFAHVRRGEVLVQDVSMSQLLAQAMLLLAGLFLKAGQDNVFGSVHELLVCCQKPLTSETLGLEIFSHPAFLYKGLVLIDPDRRIPTLDCAELARQSSSELDLREQLAFEALRSASEQVAGRQDEAYSNLRLWITEHPVTSVAQMRSFAREEHLQVATNFLLACYEPVNPRHLINGELHVCSTCGAPMRRSQGVSSLFACTIPQCARFDVPVDSVAHDVGPETLIARAHILLYWVGPGLDESAIYRRAQKLGLAPRAYPGRDACDISLDGDTVGVDVKSYSNPYVLAAKLNTSLGGLALYPTRIVAINDKVLVRFHGYLDILRNRYNGPLPVRFMPVRELMKTMEIPF